MLGKTSSFLVWLVMLTCLSVFLGAEDIRAQSKAGIAPWAGRVVLIDPKEPRGGLTIIRARGADPATATEGMLVRRGDLLILAAAAKAFVICGGGDKHLLKPGRQGCPCTTPCVPEICGISYDGSTLRNTRNGDTSNSPYPIVLSPRGGQVLNSRPTLKWAPIDGARDDTAYTVTLYGENQKLMFRRTVVGKTELAYPDDAQALSPGHDYLPVVSTDPAVSDLDNAPGRGFNVVTNAGARDLSKMSQRIKQLKLPEAQTRFLMANLYAAKQLYAEAIELLESPKCMTGPATIRMLGDIYLAAGLNREAETRYTEALRLQPESEFEERALLESGLGWVYQNLGAFDVAIEKFEEAIRVYVALGDVAAAKRLKQQVERLSQ